MGKEIERSGVLSCMGITLTLSCMQSGTLIRTRSFPPDIPLLLAFWVGSSMMKATTGHLSMNIDLELWSIISNPKEA